MIREYFDRKFGKFGKGKNIERKIRVDEYVIVEGREYGCIITDDRLKTCLKCADKHTTYTKYCSRCGQEMIECKRCILIPKEEIIIDII